LAELCKQERNLGNLTIVIVPGPLDGFRDDDAPYPTNNKSWRLQNILIPVCSLLPSPATLIVCRSREEAIAIEGKLASSVFPEGYTTSEPKAEFLWSGITAAAARGIDVPKFRASKEATANLSLWLNTHVEGRKPVVITLRETSYAEARNSNTAAWVSFAKSLDAEKYIPIFVRDTERLFQCEDEAFSRFLTCPMASTNTDLRLALYEQAWLNLMVPNGPNSLCWLSHSVHSITFKMQNDGWDNTSSVMLASLGIALGGQSDLLGPYQRLVWELDDADIIEREFNAITAELERVDKLQAPEVVKEPEDPFEIGVRLQMTGRMEDATSIYQDVVQKDPDNADAWHMLAIIAHQAERPETAETLLKRALTLKSDQGNYFVTYGHILRNLSRNAEAEAAFKRAIELEPNDAGAFADLANVLAVNGNQVGAESAMMSALKISPNNVEYFERAGQLLKEGGNPSEAAQFYQRAIELRDETIKRVRQAQSHMSEIPQVTMTT
jgi:tetratricopeptide (TPR) repeat protein